MVDVELRIGTDAWLVIGREFWTHGKKEFVAIGPICTTKKLRQHCRLVSELFPIPGECYVYQCESEVRWSPTAAIKLMKECVTESNSLAVLHSHGDGPLQFTAKDIEAGLQLRSLVNKQFGESLELCLVIVNPDKNVRAMRVNGTT